MSTRNALVEAYGGHAFYQGVKVTITRSVTQQLLTHPFWSKVPLFHLRKETRSRVRKVLLDRVYEPCSEFITETGGATISVGEDGRMVRIPLKRSS